jgi:hypothetical protein
MHLRPPARPPVRCIVQTGAAKHEARCAIPARGRESRAARKSISVEQIAQAMIATAQRHPLASATYHCPEMMELVADGLRSSRARVPVGVL